MVKVGQTDNSEVILDSLQDAGTEHRVWHATTEKLIQKGFNRDRRLETKTRLSS